MRHRLDDAVDGVELVVARALAWMVVLGEQRRGIVRQGFPGGVARPEYGRAGELVERQPPLNDAAGGRTVVEQESAAVAGEGEGNVEHFRVGQRLLDTVADRVVVVLCLDDGKRDAGLVEQHIVRAAHGARVALAKL
jgi:hypothetical protein